jgi:hypothetical protein
VCAAPVFGGDVFHGFVMLISSKYHLSVVMAQQFFVTRRLLPSLVAMYSCDAMLSFLVLMLPE